MSSSAPARGPASLARAAQDPLRGFLFAAAVVWHVLAVVLGGLPQAAKEEQARDFASYFYAVQVASAGGDPYDTAALSDLARDQGVRRAVHPFLYAPPFLLGMTWALHSEVTEAYRTWFWVDELLGLLAMLVLWRWWRSLGEDVGLVLALLFAGMTAVPNNHVMGQANFPGLLLTFGGLMLVDRGRSELGGALVGAAAMLKMSPALFLVWFAIRGEWRAITAAIAAAVGLSALVLPLAGPAVQLEFYREILPTFSTGWYNGLAVPISLFGNHSLPNVADALFPGREHVLSPAARVLSFAGAVLPMSAAAVWFREPATGLPHAARAAYFGVLLLLIPVFTYEHHLVFALPAALVAVLAVRDGRLPGWATVPVGAAVAVLLVDLQLLKGMYESLPSGLWLVSVILRELKFFALVALLGVTGAIGRGADPAP